MAKPIPRLTREEPLYYGTCSSPQGRIGLAATPRGLCLMMLRLSSDSDFLRHLKTRFHQAPIQDPAVFEDVIQQLTHYFSGTLKKFTCRLDLSGGTPFQRKVWQALITIPYGSTRSYHWVANRIGRPRAVRAVGNANGKNPVPIIVPCHRVIRADGGLGGFTGGVNLKHQLLNREQASYGTVSNPGDRPA